MEALSNVDFDAYADFVGNQESQFITSLSSHVETIAARLDGTQNFGDPLPWSKSHGLVALRPKEVSIWGGINGHGKSQFLGMVAAWLITHSRVCIASLEMPIEATGARMVRQVSGVSRPSYRFLEAFSNWTDGRLWVYDQLDSVETIRIYGVIAYCAKELGINHVIIDSLSKCGIADDDYNGQKVFVDKLAWMAKALNIHIHLVHHVRKGEREGQKPGKFDIRGASALTDLVDNVFIVHRNKDKERKVLLGEEVDEPDASLIVAKQRHGEWEGEFAFWFHRESMQYTPDSRCKPIPYPEMKSLVMELNRDVS